MRTVLLSEILLKDEKTNISGVISAVKDYLDKGWSVDYLQEMNGDRYLEYNIISPSGSVFKSGDLIRGCCPFCDELSPDWEESFCNHSDELLNEELNARNLLELIKLEPSLQNRNLP